MDRSGTSFARYRRVPAAARGAYGVRWTARASQLRLRCNTRQLAISSDSAHASAITHRAACFYSDDPPGRHKQRKDWPPATAPDDLCLHCRSDDRRDVETNCQVSRSGKVKEPDGSKKVLLVDHNKGQCRAVVGFKDEDPGAAYMCGEPVRRGRRWESSWCAYHHEQMHVPPWLDARSPRRAKLDR